MSGLMGFLELALAIVTLIADPLNSIHLIILATVKLQLRESLAVSASIETCSFRCNGSERIDVDADVVVVDVVELLVSENIEFNGEDSAIGVTVIGEVEEAEMLR